MICSKADWQLCMVEAETGLSVDDPFRPSALRRRFMHDDLLARIGLLAMKTAPRGG